MTCEEFRNRIAEMFDFEHIGNDLWKHISECDNCRNYYAECCTVVNFITPKAKLEIPHFTIEKPRRKRHFSRQMRYLQYAALAIIAVAFAGIAAYYYAVDMPVFGFYSVDNGIEINFRSRLTHHIGKRKRKQRG